MRYTNNNNREKGFSLIELIIVLLLVVLLMSWGIPNYQNLKANRMVTDFANEMVYSFTQARAEAVRYGKTVEVRPVGGDWANGWVTVALGVDGGADETIAEQQAVDSRLVIDDINNSGEIIFNSIGGLESATPVNLSLKHNVISTAGRGVVVSMSGSAKANKL